MAQKRMFSLTVTGTDGFLDLPTSSQALYFHLGMYGDDDGFVSSPRKIMRSCGCNLDDLRLLATKGLVISFDNGVIVIRDWRLNNTLKNDRYHPTIYQNEKGKLLVDSSGRYALADKLDAAGFQVGSALEPEHNVTELNLTELNRTEQSVTEQRESADKPPRSSFSPPSLEEVRNYIDAKGYSVDAEAFVAYYSSKGWKVGSAPMKDWKAAVVTWQKREKQAVPMRKQESTVDRLARLTREGAFHE